MGKKIFTYICIVILLFIVGMMVRHFYDNYILEPKPAVAAAPQHRVVEPAKEVPADLVVKLPAPKAAEEK